jgi:EAL domain-containing protein (putative c-di-GMP-specific phosphodiesterase class I)
MSLETARLLKLEQVIHQALEKQQFTLCYQPQIEIKTGQVTAVETLIRWQHPEMGVILPSKFLALAEKTDLMLNLGKWVLRTACEQNLAWQRDGLPPMTISVNLSNMEFQQPNLVEIVGRILEKVGLDPQWLELEITEKTLRQNIASARQIFQDFQSLGVRLALDDFGRGYSALGYLKEFPFRTLKLDQVFIRDLRGNSQEKAIISAAIALSEGFNFRVVAKGVETEQQAQILRNLECKEAQGYLFSRPLSAEATHQFLKEKSAKVSYENLLV